MADREQTNSVVYMCLCVVMGRFVCLCQSGCACVLMFIFFVCLCLVCFVMYGMCKVVCVYL